jgi:hypothetical protein
MRMLFLNSIFAFLFARLLHDAIQHKLFPLTYFLLPLQTAFSRPL